MIFREIVIDFYKIARYTYISFFRDIMGACQEAIEFCHQYKLVGLPLAIIDKIENDHLTYKKWFNDHKFELSDGNVIRIDRSNGHWETTEYRDGLVIRVDSSDGYWETTEYQDGLVIRVDSSNGYWKNIEYQDGLVIRVDDSDGYWKTVEYQAGLVIRVDISNGDCETIEYWPSGQLKQINDMYIPLWDH